MPTMTAPNSLDLDSKEYGADTGLVQTMARLAEYVAAMASR